MSGCSLQMHHLMDNQTIDEDQVIASSYNENFLALTASKKSLFYDKQTQLYTWDGTLINYANLKEEDITGFYEGGLYSISLDDNKLVVYKEDGTSKKTTINSFFNKEDWTWASLSEDGNYLIYELDASLYCYDLLNETTTQLDKYNSSWELKIWNGFYAYFLDETNTLQKMNVTNGECESVELSIEIDEINRNFVVDYTDEGMEIYSLMDGKLYSIETESEDEQWISSCDNGWVTKTSDSINYYSLDHSYVYQFSYTGEIDFIHLSENGTLDVILNGQLCQYELEDANHVTGIVYQDEGYISGYQRIDVTVIGQRPNYPTGCETISTMMLLDYLGEDLDTDTFIDEYLDTSSISVNSYGQTVAASPYDAFVGNPRSENSYGCFSPVIEEALTQYFGSDKYVVNTTGLTLNQLCHSYIDQGHPVLVWASINMLSIYDSGSWITPSEDTYTWPANEHCLLLVGYDDYYYYFNDPWTGSVEAYSQWVVEDCYETLGCQSLTVLQEK